METENEELSWEIRGEKPQRNYKLAKLVGKAETVHPNGTHQ